MTYLFLELVGGTRKPIAAMSIVRCVDVCRYKTGAKESAGADRGKKELQVCRQAEGTPEWEDR